MSDGLDPDSLHAGSVDAAVQPAIDMLTWNTRHAVDSIHLELNGTVAAPRVARRAVARLADRSGATAEELENVHTVISEAVTNCVRHAYPGKPGPIYLDAGIVGSDLTVVITDDGLGPRQPSHNPGLGMGWKLMAQLTDCWAVVQRGEGGTMLYLRMRLSDPRAGRRVPRV
jgi:stage II sporulation protein AB (anti-sigma F factor)